MTKFMWDRVWHAYFCQGMTLCTEPISQHCMKHYYHTRQHDCREMSLISPFTHIVVRVHLSMIIVLMQMPSHTNRSLDFVTHTFHTSYSAFRSALSETYNIHNVSEQLSSSHRELTSIVECIALWIWNKTHPDIIQHMTLGKRIGVYCRSTIIHSDPKQCTPLSLKYQASLDPPWIKASGRTETATTPLHSIKDPVALKQKNWLAPSWSRGTFVHHRITVVKPALPLWNIIPFDGTRLHLQSEMITCQSGRNSIRQIRITPKQLARVATSDLHADTNDANKSTNRPETSHTLLKEHASLDADHNLAICHYCHVHSGRFTRAPHENNNIQKSDRFWFHRSSRVVFSPKRGRLHDGGWGWQLHGGAGCVVRRPLVVSEGAHLGPSQRQPCFGRRAPRSLWAWACLQTRVLICQARPPDHHITTKLCLLTNQTLHGSLTISNPKELVDSKCLSGNPAIHISLRLVTTHVWAMYSMNILPTRRVCMSDTYRLVKSNNKLLHRTRSTEY